MLIEAVKQKSTQIFTKVVQSPSWSTLKMIVQDSNAMNGIQNSVSNNEPPWACRHCTFVNISASSCEMCGLPNE